MVILFVIFYSKFCLFHNSNVFGSCIIQILYTGCAKIKKKKFRRQKFNGRNPLVGIKPSLFFYNSTSSATAKSLHQMHVTVFGMGKRKMHNSSMQTWQLTSTTLRQEFAWPGCRLKDRPVQCADNAITFNEYSTWSRKMPALVSHHLREELSTGYRRF